MIYRFTGPPENWITATHYQAWAFNEHNKGLWERLQPGDTAIFHSTAKTGVVGAKAVSSVVGIGFIGHGAFQKKDYWWVQEKETNSVIWPYVIPFKELYFFSDTTNIDFAKDVSLKSDEELAKDIEVLLSSAIPLATPNASAKA